mmetsp:Transcript_36948/g.42463  ORF Transcript_36948/g.42463 Transcript_36948/m.42463 type:complete len:121 (-) Transcript_36948:396-758(-)
MASFCSTSGLTEDQIKEYENQIHGEVLSDLIFNTASAYSSINGSEKLAAKKLKESFTVAEEHEESGSVKYPILATFIASRLLENALKVEGLRASETNIDSLEPKSFDSQENEVIFENNLA